MNKIKINEPIAFNHLPEGMEVQNDVHAIVIKEEFNHEDTTIKVTYKLFVDGAKANDYDTRKTAISAKTKLIEAEAVKLKLEENNFKNATTTLQQVNAQKNAMEHQEQIKTLRGEMKLFPAPNDKNHIEHIAVLSYTTATKMSTAKINDDLMAATGITEFEIV